MITRVIAACGAHRASVLLATCVAVVIVATASVTSVAHADVFVYTTFLDGPSEFPPNAVPGTGTARVEYDDEAHSMRVIASFQDLTGTTTAAHIHAPIPDPPSNPTAGVATQLPSFSGFPIGVTSGAMDTMFDLTLASSWNPSYVTNNGGSPATAEVAFFTAMNDGRAYFNIHSNFDTSGEIRGFFALIPEPISLVLLVTGVATIGAWRRFRSP